MPLPVSRGCVVLCCTAIDIHPRSHRSGRSSMQAASNTSLCLLLRIKAREHLRHCEQRECRHVARHRTQRIQYAAASDHRVSEYWSPARNDAEYGFAISRHDRPRFASSFALSRIRGRREDRVLAAPAVSRAICANKNCTRAYRAAGTLRPSLRNGFTAYFVLFPENGSFASVARRNFASPGLNASTATSEPHDFTVRLSRTRQSQLSRPSHLTARS